MSKIKFSTGVTLILGMISFIWLVLAFAALTDIWHGIEPDLSAEWWIVSRGFVPLTLFHMSSLFSIFLVWRERTRLMLVTA